MLSFSGQVRIFVHAEPVNMKKSFEGLGAIINNIFHAELTTGAYFAFFNRRRDCIKVLYWDGDGLVIWYKRLEKGSFLQQNLAQGLVERRDFLMLLEGVTPKRIQCRYRAI